MNKTKYEEHLKSINAASSAACDKHGLNIVEMIREENGVKCPKCGLFIEYEKLVRK